MLQKHTYWATVVKAFRERPLFHRELEASGRNIIRGSVPKDVLQRLVFRNVSASFPNYNTKLSFVVACSVLGASWDGDCCRIWACECEPRLCENFELARNRKSSFLGQS